jgi:hypothetical protein
MYVLVFLTVCTILLYEFSFLFMFLIDNVKRSRLKRSKNTQPLSSHISSIRSTTAAGDMQVSIRLSEVGAKPVVDAICDNNSSMIFDGVSQKPVEYRYRADSTYDDESDNHVSLFVEEHDDEIVDPEEPFPFTAPPLPINSQQSYP